jgi:phosphonate transport system substrate-binding protein
VKISRRWFLGLLLLSACSAKSAANRGGSFTVGAVSYGEGSKALDRYDRFKRYLSERTGSVVEFEPAFNENKALERIQNRAWTLVFAPPGLAAIAISRYQYTPLFPLAGVQNLRSVFVVREDSDIQKVAAIAGKSVALGQPGSATGYYLPLFNVYGLALSELVLSPTPSRAGLSMREKAEWSSCFCPD